MHRPVSLLAALGLGGCHHLAPALVEVFGNQQVGKGKGALGGDKRECWRALQREVPTK